MKKTALLLILVLVVLLLSPAALLAKKKAAAPEVPAGVKSEVGEKAITLTWEPVDGAKGYYVYRSSEKSDEDFAQVASVKKTTYTDKSAKKETTYMYYVVAYNDGGKSDRSELTVSAIGGNEVTGSPKPIFIGFEAFRDGKKTVNECALIKFEDRTIWISHTDNEKSNYPPMVNCGTLPTFPGKPETAALGFGINKDYRFMFFYEPNGGQGVFISASKYVNSWTEWSALGELPTPAGYRKGGFKFAFGVSGTYFCCVALDTKTFQTFEATCSAGGKSWSPWKAIGKVGIPRFLKGGCFWNLAYDDGIYYGVMQQPETNAFWYNIFNGASWGDWNEGAQKPPMPEWILR